jgi:hypothetical protein
VVMVFAVFLTRFLFLILRAVHIPQLRSRVHLCKINLSFDCPHSYKSKGTRFLKVKIYKTAILPVVEYGC